MIMMDHLINSTDRQDGLIIARMAPIAREIGQLTAEYFVSFADVDIQSEGDDTGEAPPAEEGEDDDDA